MSAAVVRLPTAARRQVRQPQNKMARAAKAAIRDQQFRKFPYVPATIREAQSIAEAIHPMTPERWMLLGLLHVMPAEQFSRFAQYSMCGGPAVMGLMKLAKGKVGLNLDVMNALERLSQ